MRGRYYSSKIRRFISEDPAKDGLNWYAYCSNNPIMYVDPWGMADDPTDGVKSLNWMINSLMKLIECKVDYNNGETKNSHKKANAIRRDIDDVLYDTKNNQNICAINEYSPEIAKIVEDDVISGNGTLQQISSLLAVYVELRYNIINGKNIKPGDTIIPEPKIRGKYEYYVSTGDIFLSGMNAYEIRKKIIPKSHQTSPMQNTYTGNTPWGYWVRVIYYDMYKQGNDDVFNLETEDLPHV